MASKKSPETEHTPELVSALAVDWFIQFKKHFSIAFQDECDLIPAHASDSDLQKAAMKAAIETLRDSGMPDEVLLDALGDILQEARAPAKEWTPALNQRRVELIDKDIQGEISFEEKIELSGLTRIMRQLVDTESNVPLKGAKALHKKLLEMERQEKPR